MNKSDIAKITDLTIQWRKQAEMLAPSIGSENYGTEEEVDDTMATTLRECATALERAAGLPSFDEQYHLIDGDGALWIFGATHWLCVNTDPNLTAEELRDEMVEAIDDWALYSVFPGLDAGAAKLIDSFGVKA